MRIDCLSEEVLIILDGASGGVVVGGRHNSWWCVASITDTSKKFTNTLNDCSCVLKFNNE